MEKIDLISFMKALLLLVVFNLTLFYIILNSVAFFQGELWVIKSVIVVSNISILMVCLGTIKRTSHNKGAKSEVEE